MCEILATFFFLRFCLMPSLHDDMAIVDCTATLCARSPVLGSAYAVDDRKRGPSLSGGQKRRLDAQASSLGLKLSVFVALLCVGDRLPKTAVTGIPSCYCVYYVENNSSVRSFG